MPLGSTLLEMRVTEKATSLCNGKSGWHNWF